MSTQVSVEIVNSSDFTFRLDLSKCHINYFSESTKDILLKDLGTVLPRSSQTTPTTGSSVIVADGSGTSVIFFYYNIYITGIPQAINHFTFQIVQSGGGKFDLIGMPPFLKQVDDIESPVGDTKQFKFSIQAA